ncbi:unnamed protein product [Prorocentrum cordatum]|uniref:Uncharacterized protein n=1 Tax=Prorocentrum cordatum TaxID=2364126 RepID=A0ABN9QVA4_9DINO|nr:unnamed protein product [Polarella glacialis]
MARIGHCKFCELNKRYHDTLEWKMIRGKAAADETKAEWQANPADKKYARKSLIQSSQFQKSHSSDTFSTNRDLDRPMTRQAFHCHCQDILGLTELEESEWWQELEENPRIDRDNKGCRGRLQLWIPVGPEWERGGRRSVQSAFVEKGSEQKNMSESEAASIKEFVQESSASTADSFFSNKLELQIVLKRKDALDEVSVKKEYAVEAGSASGKKRKVSHKVYVPERDCPKIHANMVTDIAKLNTAFAANQRKVDDVTKRLQSIPVTETNDAKPFVSYIKSLQTRWQLTVKWKGLHNVIKLFNLSVDNGNAASASPAHSYPPTPGSGSQPAPLPDSDMQSISLLDLAEREKARKPFAGDPTKIKSLNEMHTLCEEDLDDLVETWNECLAIATELNASVKTTCGHIESHLTQKRKRQEREARDLEKKQQADALKKVKEEAAQAAAAIRAKVKQPLQPSALAVKPIFLASWSHVEDADAVTEVPANDSMSWNMPFAVKENDDITLLIGSSGIQKELTAWATEFSKTQDLRGQKHLQGHGKAAENGLTEAAHFFEKWKPPTVDISAVDGGSAFVNSIWKLGFKEEMTWTGFTPNCAALMRRLAAGKVHCLMVDTTTVFATMLKEDCPEVIKKIHAPGDVAATIEAFANLDDDGAKQAVDAGITARKTIQVAKSLLYAPMGWMVAEMCLKGEALNYGIRKSTIVMTEVSKEHFDQATRLFMEMKKDTSRMEAILALI